MDDDDDDDNYPYLDREGPRNRIVDNFLGRFFHHNSRLQASLGAAIFVPG